ncbi:TAXI family TRAP transporter solute-binding subunit [Aquicoccus porphyridii]|uniref:TAXI family TRAP transporter solute-binding subunit n=1 Tax=Aquicoccus porphyridii TaxID=1852029 RepID=A0A5A9Z711_9RHOB|nr:TAXI family TRAP transporter solute-binding subunit [Aquicoccus porphyridii]KAA0912973.1 TAXI family TRAP transporter solute-binding subunit [Aquicoccus porphyridii]RAI54290.1 C4-dicarboxylate ABC transporter [Rhodobacteraceae bacterium AsT-22]
MHKFSLTMALCLMGAPITAQEVDLPGQITWTAYGTGSAGYNQSVAIGAALQNAGVNLRVLPGKNDIARTEPVRQGKVQFSANGVGGSFMAQEGVFQFGAKNWGPQPVRVLAANNGGTVGLSLAVAAEACEKAGKPGCEGFTYADLEGMRVSVVKGAPSLNTNNEAYLAYGGLTWDDVEVVEFGGFGDSWKGMIDGSTDAAFASTNSGMAYEAASGPRGVYWPPIDPDDTEALERMQGVAPFFAPMMATVGANIDGTDGVATAGYAYPVLMTYADQDEDLTYNMTKAMHVFFDDYVGNAPGINGWALDKQDFQWVAPYHDGAIRYYEEIGAWTDEAQAHNDMLIARQAALMEAWEELMAEDPDNWEEAWATKRREALAEGGFAVVF